MKLWYLTQSPSLGKENQNKMHAHSNHFEECAKDESLEVPELI